MPLARLSSLVRPPAPWVAAALFYTAVALFQLYPAWTDPLHGVVGDWTHPDTIGNHWLYRWLTEQLSSGAWSVPAGSPLVEAGAVRYITLNREYFPGELAPLLGHHADMFTAWFGPPVVRSGGVRVWDLSRLQGDRTWTFPAWEAPDDYVSTSGLASLPPTVRAAGWRNWPRNVPPAAPAASVTEADTRRYDALPSMVRRKLERSAAATDSGPTLDDDDTDASP